MNNTSRKIPTATAISIIFGRTSTMVGWFIFAFLMIFAWGFGGNADVSFVHFMGESKATSGRIIEVDETNMEINERTVWINLFSYFDEEGNEFVGKGYTTGKRFRANQEIQIEYPVSASDKGRIPDVRTAQFSTWLLLSFLFPGIGILMVYFGIRRGLVDYRILKVGNLTRAKLIDKDATNMEVNDRKVYKLTFEYTANDDKKYTKVIKTHETAEFEDEDFERLFYDPHNPVNSTLVDDLAGSPEVNDNGDIVKLDNKLPLKPILWPVICLAPHVWYATTLI